MAEAAGPGAPGVPVAPAAGGASRRAAVLGSPIAHSLSPALHLAAYAALKLADWQYDRIECGEADLAGFVDGLGPEWVGLSLTMPLKRAALRIAEEVAPLAAGVGAANTLLLGGGPGQGHSGRRAENTDVHGIVQALREAGVRRVRHAVILGAGGTAQAALAAVRELGEPAPRVLVRDPTRAADLRAAADRLGMRPAVRGGLPETPLPEADLVISTLPAGAADAVRARWAPSAMLLDVVYAPWPTRLAAAAHAAGCQVVSGLAVLLHQAVAQVELMTGCPGPVEPMRTALNAAVRARNPLTPPPQGAPWFGVDPVN